MRVNFQSIHSVGYPVIPIVLDPLITLPAYALLKLLKYSSLSRIKPILIRPAPDHTAGAVEQAKDEAKNERDSHGDLVF